MAAFGPACSKGFRALAGMACVAGLVLVSPSDALATLKPGFDDQASLFKFFYDCHPVRTPCPGHAAVSDVRSPSQDDDALKINYKRGNPSYMGADAYIRLGTDASARRYQVNYDFYFPNKAPIQALEFCMNNYFGGKRYQWAMQWENVGSGAPRWRLWNGRTWQPFGVPASNIKARTWYKLTIDGNIIKGHVHYLDFIVHRTTHSLSKYTFSPTPEAGAGLVAAVQVDGNSHADPYQLYLDNAHFYWSNRA